MTKEQAQLILDACSIESTLDNEGEVELLREQNPELLDAYEALKLIAVGG